jgi:ornithine cyclodeaminase/alanine dehydrogenase-like protein (mu-crystallin family)
VSTIGPQTVDGHELPLDIIDVADLIVTDSIPQTQAYGSPFIVPEPQLVSLDQIVSGAVQGRSKAAEITLFCSVGLAGTEVVLGNYVLDQYRMDS